MGSVEDISWTTTGDGFIPRLAVIYDATPKRKKRKGKKRKKARILSVVKFQ